MPALPLLPSWAQLEQRWLTGAFWLAVLGYSAAFWVTPFPPAIDYPQHLAIATQLSRLWESGSPESGQLMHSWLSYNGTFHVLTALLAKVVPPEVAGKLVLSLVAPLTATAALVFLETAQRPKWLACFALPFCYSHALGWGFVNFSLGAPLALLTFALWLRWQRRGRAGSAKLGFALTGLSLLLAYTHVLAMVCLCLLILVGFFAESLPRRVGGREWLVSLMRAPLPLMPAVGYSLIVWQSHRAAPNIYWENHDGLDLQAWQKVWHFGRFATGNQHDGVDQQLLLIGLASLLLLPIVAWLARWRLNRATQVFRIQAWVWLLLYLITPRVVMSSWFIFERLPIFFVFFLLAALPLPSPLTPSLVRKGQPDPPPSSGSAPLPEWLRWFPILAATFAIVGSVNTIRSFRRIPDAADASAILDDIPSGKKVVGVLYDTDGDPGITRKLWVHLPAYYLVRRRGELGYSFLRYASLPVRYRSGVVPPPDGSLGFEWVPSRFDVTSAQGRYFDTVLVRSPSADEDPKTRVFGIHAKTVKLTSQRGRFYLYDTSGVPR